MTGRPLRLGPVRLRVGQRVLLRRRPGRVRELDGLLLRLVGRGQLDHRRQDPDVVVGDGRLGAGLRPQQLEHPGAAGADGRGDGRRAVRDRRSGGSARPPGCSPGRCWPSPRSSVLMFRFNNPDALLVLLLVGAAYAMVRALEVASTQVAARWPGVLVGCGFLTKMLQAFLVLPVFALVYLLAAPTPVRRRLGQLLGALAAMIVSAGWWVAVVELRPCVVPSVHRRVADQQRPGAGARLQRPRPADRRRDRQRRRRRRSGRRHVGSHGLGADVRRRDRRADRLADPRRAAAAGRRAVAHRGAVRAPTVVAPPTCSGAAGCSSPGWCSASWQGIFHAYYTVALAPAVAALVGMGGVSLWERRSELVPRVLLAVDGRGHRLVVVAAAGAQRRLERLAGTGRAGRRPGDRGGPAARRAVRPHGSRPPLRARRWSSPWPGRRRTR